MMICYAVDVYLLLLGAVCELFGIMLFIYADDLLIRVTTAILLRQLSIDNENDNK